MTENIDEVSMILSLVGMTMSVPFLLLTFIIYALLPERNLYAKCVMCYVFTLFWVYLLPLLALIYVKFGNLTMLTCKIISMFNYFFIISSFLWINVIAIDIWLTFSGKKRILNNERKRFLKYSIYAWGIPTFLVISIIAIDNIALPTSWYSPFDGCWFKDGNAEMIYLYGPLGIVLTTNVGLFIATAWKIIKTRKQTAMLRENGNQTHNSKTEVSISFKLYIKLMFAMGMNWSMEIMQWIIKWKIANLPFLWYLTDMINASLGVLVFFMFVFNRNTWKLLKKRYYLIKGIADPTQTAVGTRISNNETETVNGKSYA